MPLLSLASDIQIYNTLVVRVPTVDGTFSTFKMNTSADVSDTLARCSSSFEPLVVRPGNFWLSQPTVKFYCLLFYSQLYIYKLFIILFLNCVSINYVRLTVND